MHFFLLEAGLVEDTEHEAVEPRLGVRHVRVLRRFVKFVHK